MGESIKQICCCGARVWALVIGWFESIGCGLAIVIYSIGFAQYKSRYYEAEDLKGSIYGNYKDNSRKASSPDTATAVAFYVALTFLLIGLLSAILLLVGLKQKNEGKMKVKIWLVIHVVFTLVEIIGGVALMILTGAILAIFPSAILSAIINLFCIWVVNVHRKELLLYEQPLIA